MGELPFFRARSALHPDHLWIWERSVYVDENQRTWLPIIIEMESSLQVLMRQEDVLLGEAVCPGLLAPGLVPSMWQLYPGRRYRGSDSSFWRIVYHIEEARSQEEKDERMPRALAIGPLLSCSSVARRRCSLSSCRTRSMSDEVTGIVDYHASCAGDRLTR
uniref:T cell leukemia/lymphoma 1A n=1 Tax=Felis catus TaxID=9685 RepID=A0ABI7XAZ1_FELCA